MTTSQRLALSTLITVSALVVLPIAQPRAANPRFFSDDPIQREPETQDASRVQEWDIDLFWDLAENMFGKPGDRALDVRAGNINTVDEVPDSNWFTNRIGARPLSVEDAVRGPLTGTGPAPGTWTVTRGKAAGFAPGFTAKDAKGETWFVSFDGDGTPESATGALMVANKIFWALGYWQVENYIAHLRPEEITVDSSATITPPSGVKRQMKMGDVEAVLRRSHRSADGSYRAVAARALPGRVLGGFRYYGTRPDDPNDVVPHEHRRELRALKVFGAWTNLVDMKAGNTLDTLITENGKGVVRHYLQDVGSTFGAAALGLHDYDEGWEHLYEGDLLLKRLVTFGFYLQPWQTAKYADNDTVGPFEGVVFDPEKWKPRVPTAAFLRARADDNFWAARRVMAFSDEMIRRIATTAQFSDEKAAALLADVLIQRRDKIGRTYLNAINPVIDFAMGDDGTLTFDNAAVKAGVASAPASGYIVHWASFDNATGRTTPLGSPTATTDRRTKAQVELPSAAGAIVRARIAAASKEQPAWAAPVDAFFRRSGRGWTLVGVDRLPAAENDAR